MTRFFVAYQSLLRLLTRDLFVYCIAPFWGVRVFNREFRNLIRQDTLSEHIEYANTLIELGAYRYKFDYSLSQMIKNDHLDMVQYLVSKGADIHAHDDFALIVAVNSDNIHIIRYLITVGANVRAQDDSAISNAAQYSSFDTIKELINAGANTHANAEMYGEYVLNNVVRRGMFNAVECILSVDSSYYKFLFRLKDAVQIAAQHGHHKIVIKLVDFANNVYITNIAFKYAMKSNRFGMIGELIQKGADVDYSNGYALRHAAKASRNMVDYLLSAGADIDAKHSRAFLKAVCCGRMEIVSLLVSRGTDIHVNNDCAIIKAAETGNLNMIKYLSSIGLSIHASDDQALSRAVQKGYMDMVCFLLNEESKLPESVYWTLKRWQVEGSINLRRDKTLKTLGIKNSMGYL